MTIFEFEGTPLEYVTQIMEKNKKRKRKDPYIQTTESKTDIEKEDKPADCDTADPHN